MRHAQIYDDSNWLEAFPDTVTFDAPDHSRAWAVWGLLVFAAAIVGIVIAAVT